MSETATGQRLSEISESMSLDVRKENEDRLDALLDAIDAAIAGHDRAAASELTDTYLPSYPISMVRERQAVREKAVKADLELDRQVEEIDAALRLGDFHHAARLVEKFEDDYPDKSLERIIEERRRATQTDSEEVPRPGESPEVLPNAESKEMSALRVIDEAYVSKEYERAAFLEHVFALMYSKQLMLDLRAARKLAQQQRQKDQGQ